MKEPEPISANDLQTAAEYYDQVRRQIEHEDNLATQRLSWLMASQSFLLSAYAIILSGMQSGKSKTPLELYRANFCHLLPIIGILSSGLIYASICGGMLAIGRLRSDWASHKPQTSVFKRPPIQSGGVSFLLGQSAPRLLPLVLVGLWIYLLLGARFGSQ